MEALTIDADTAHGEGLASVGCSAGDRGVNGGLGIVGGFIILILAMHLGLKRLEADWACFLVDGSCSRHDRRQRIK